MKGLRIAPSAGSGDGWGGNLPLSPEYPEQVELDLRRLRFVVPTFLLRLRTFVDWHLAEGRAVRVRCPEDPDVNRYMARMRIDHDLPDGTFDSLLTVREHDQRDVLIPVNRLHEFRDVDQLVDSLSPIVDAHVAAVKRLAQPFLLAVSELCGNAVEHGQGRTGCYVAAQRYRTGPSLQLAIADLGIGIPEHLRQRYPDLKDDGAAIMRATQEGVSGTGDQHRGYGFSQVIEEAAAADVPFGVLIIRSGRGLVQVSQRPKEWVTMALEAPYKRGSWISFEFGAP